MDAKRARDRRRSRLEVPAVARRVIEPPVAKDKGLIRSLDLRRRIADVAARAAFSQPERREDLEDTALAKAFHVLSRARV